MNATDAEKFLTDFTKDLVAHPMDRQKLIAGWAKHLESATGVNGATSDGYHTFNELYDHRIALFIALMKAHPEISWRAMQHADGSRMDGWFIAGMHLPSGDISYHLPETDWDKLLGVGEARTKAPEWDGHTPADVVIRLQNFMPLEETNV